MSIVNNERMIQEPRVSMGSGIICVSIPPGMNDVYFLLGKERHVSNWNEGSNKWSEFGGSLKEPEESFEQCAAREFIEETLGLIDISSSSSSTLMQESSTHYEHYDSHALKQMEVHLCEQLSTTHKNYIIAIDRIVHCKNNNIKKIFKKRYYVVQVPWCPDIKHKYEKLRNILFRLQKKSKEYAKYKSDVLKTRGSSIITLRDSSQKHHLNSMTSDNSIYPFSDSLNGLLIGDYYTDIENNKTFVIVGITISTPFNNNTDNTTTNNNNSNSKCSCIKKKSDTSYYVSLVYSLINIETNEYSSTNVHYFVTFYYKMAIRAWNELFMFYNTKIGREYKNHPAIIINTICDHVTNIKIHDHFMEKRLIDWWGINSLKKHLLPYTDYKMSSQREKLRNNFKEPLGIAIQYIDEVLNNNNNKKKI